MTEIKEITDKNLWEQFIIKNGQGNFLQSWNWGECQNNLGHKIFRLGFFEKEQLRGISLLIKQLARRGTYLECPGGPLIDWEQPDFFQKFIDQVKIIGKKENCLFARVRPQILETIDNKRLFKKYGFVSSPMHLHAETTWQLDITKPEEQLLSEMRKTTRYLIKKAIKDGVTIEKSDNLNEIDLLYQLQQKTVARHHFVPFPKKYFTEEFKAFIKDKQIQLFKAIYQHKTLAAALIIFYGRQAVYHYSGSDLAFSRIPSSYLLQWEAIREAKKQDCKIYNFWGIAPTDNPKHRFSGVTLFKKGFGGFRVDYLHAQDFPLDWRYWLVHYFEKGRRIYRRL